MNPVSMFSLLIHKSKVAHTRYRVLGSQDESPLLFRHTAGEAGCHYFPSRLYFAYSKETSYPSLLGGQEEVRKNIRSDCLYIQIQNPWLFPSLFYILPLHLIQTTTANFYHYFLYLNFKSYPTSTQFNKTLLQCA